MTTFFTSYKKNINLLLFLAIIFGAILGYNSPELGQGISIFGELFLRALKLLIVPVIFLSVLCGIINLDSTSGLGRLGVKTFLYYTLTTALAVVIGLGAVNLLRPGLSGDSKLSAPSAATSNPESESRGGIRAVILNMVPTNIVKAASDGNVLGLIAFTVFLGIALLQSSQPAFSAAKDTFNALFGALIWMVEGVMLTAPLGIFALVSDLVGETVLSGALTETGRDIAWYSLTVVAGLAAHGIVALPLFLVFSRISPLDFLKALAPALTTAFSTASSAATLPVTIDSLEHRAKVPNRFASFVAPLGATINMDGTAIYESVAAVFIANMYGIELSLLDQLTIFLTATFSAIGAAGIPGAGLVMMTVVLNAVNIPVEGIALIVAVDRPLDMLRTAVNVWGDSIGAAVIAQSEKA